MAAFKKTFLSFEHLQEFGPRWAAGWREDASALKRGDIQPAEFCARMVLHVYQTLFGSRYRNGLRKHVFSFPQREDFRGLNELARFRIRSLPEAAELALLRWAAGDIKLQIFEHVPSPVEVLRLQKEGIRCLSVLYREEDILSFRHEGRDFFSFLIHDLIHAQLMTADRESYQMQMKFARLIDSEWEELSQGLCDEGLRELEYMASDMNSHIVHLTQTFKSWMERRRPDLCQSDFSWMRSFRAESMIPERPHFHRIWNELSGSEKARAHVEVYEFWKAIEL